MSQTTCPNGHVSADPEWCDTCGARLGAAPAGSPADGAPAVGVDSQAPLSDPPTGIPVSGFDSVPCPHCGAGNVSDALFCEECGYDFTTGQAPEPVPATTLPAVSGPASTAVPAPTPGSSPGSSPAGVLSSADSPPVVVAPGPPGWIVIVEVDPTWFALKGTLADRPCPSPSSSTIPLGQAVVHIGRSSQSRGIHPEIAMDSDTAVSRRHAQLIATVAGSSSGGAGDTAAADSEPDAYAAVDLGSTNGTFVVPAGSEPTESIEPIAPGVAVTLTDGDHVYIGAWSRLTIRHTGA